MNNISLCVPALVYLVVAIIFVLLTITKMSATSLITKSFFVLLWTWFLNYLCNKGHTGIAWFLVIVPFLFLMLILIFSIEILAVMLKQGDFPLSKNKK